MDDKTRKILERPFATDLLRYREGPGGIRLGYVEVQHYLDRLNEAFGGDWSLEVVRREHVEDQLLVEVRLTAGGVVKVGLGGATVTRRKDNGKMCSLADDYKKAEADAIKRASRLLGIGASLYHDDAEANHLEHDGHHLGRPSRDEEDPRELRGAARPAPMTPERPSEPTSSRPPERVRLTARQLGAIQAIGRARGLDPRELRDRVRQEFGCVPEHLTRIQASQLLTRLNGNGASGSQERVVGEQG